MGKGARDRAIAPQGFPRSGSLDPETLTGLDPETCGESAERCSKVSTPRSTTGGMTIASRFIQCA